jgi:hypothetical protein
MVLEALDPVRARLMAVLARDNIQRRTIRLLLRCHRTGLYFAGAGWTDDVTAAKTYGDEVDAVRACFRNGLEDVELVLRAPGTTKELLCTPIR